MNSSPSVWERRTRIIRITVPSEVMDVLRWHLDTQLSTPEQKASELLFPAEDGGFEDPRFAAALSGQWRQLVSARLVTRYEG